MFWMLSVQFSKNVRHARTNLYRILWIAAATTPSSQYQLWLKSPISSFNTTIMQFIVNESPMTFHLPTQHHMIAFAMCNCLYCMRPTIICWLINSIKQFIIERIFHFHPNRLYAIKVLFFIFAYAQFNWYAQLLTHETAKCVAIGFDHNFCEFFSQNQNRWNTPIK